LGGGEEVEGREGEVAQDAEGEKEGEDKPDEEGADAMLLFFEFGENFSGGEGDDQGKDEDG
jgi:hypothetical protein